MCGQVVFCPRCASGRNPRGAVVSVLDLDFIELYVADAERAAAVYCQRLGLAKLSARVAEDRHRIAVGRGEFRMVLTSPKNSAEIASFLERHGEGVRTIALRVEGLKTLYPRVVKAGGTQVQPPLTSKGSCSAVIGIYGDVQHLLV